MIPNVRKLDTECVITRRMLLKGLGSIGVCALLQGTRNAVASSAESASPLPGIPGALGYGSHSWGGTSPLLLPSRLSIVSRLDDYHPGDTPLSGTLRHAVSQPGPRVICLARSGTIRLKADLIIDHPYLTLTGHLAPAPGVVLSHARVVIRTHDVILSDLKIRPGDFDTDSPLADRDCLTLAGRKDGRWGEVNSAERILIHRCSLSFSCDELVSTYQHVRAFTLQHCLLSHALRYTRHGDIDPSKPPDKKNHHSMGVLINPHVKEFSLIGNVFAHTLHRMPRVMPGATGEVVNNIFYGYGSAKSDRMYMEDTRERGAPCEELRVEGNLWIPRKGVENDGPIISVGKTPDSASPTFKLLFKDNTLLSASGSIETKESGLPASFMVETAKTSAVEPHRRSEPSERLEALLLDRVGARSRNGSRDEYDEAVVSSIRERSGGPVDTVVKGRDKLNGFTISCAPFDYPKAGERFEPSPPLERQRVRSNEYSKLEAWLWASTKAS